MNRTDLLDAMQFCAITFSVCFWIITLLALLFMKTRMSTLKPRVDDKYVSPESNLRKCGGYQPRGSEYPGYTNKSTLDNFKKVEEALKIKTHTRIIYKGYQPIDGVKPPVPTTGSSVMNGKCKCVCTT